VPMWRDNRTLYTETLKRSPDAMLIANNLGQYYQSQGEYDHAAQVFRDAIAIWPRLFLQIRGNLASAYAGLGGAALKQMKLAEARDNFLKAYEIAGPDPVVFDNLGSVYLALGDNDNARSYYQKAVAINPKLERIHNNLAALALADGNLDGALASARTALGITPHIGEAHIIMARAYLRKGMPAEARASYRKAVEVDPSKSTIVDNDLRRYASLLR